MLGPPESPPFIFAIGYDVKLLPITIVGCWNGPVKGLGEPPITNCASSPVTEGSCPLINTEVFTNGLSVRVPG